MTDQPHGPHGPDCECHVTLSDDVASITGTTLIGGRDDGPAAPFVRITVTLVDGTEVASDVHPDQARQLGRQMIEAASAADSDVAVFRLLSNMGLDVETIGQMLADCAALRPGAGDASDVHPATAHLRPPPSPN